MLTGTKYQHIVNVVILIAGFSIIEAIDFTVMHKSMSDLTLEVLKNREGNNEELQLLRENRELLQKIANGQHPVADGAQ